MPFGDFLSIAIVGVLFSLVFQWLKAKLGSNSLNTKIAVVLFAIIVAAFYVWIRSTPYFETVVTVLGVASTFYAFFLKPTK